jgi:WD40 repeat protein
VRDLSSGVQEKFVPGDFPEFDPPTQPHFYVAFNALMTRAVYKGGDNIILLDLKARKILARIPDAYYDRDPVNAWQISGERAAVVGTINTEKKYDAPLNEIFIIEHDGQTRQLTHLYETLGRRFDIHGLSWSPDGGKIAFWAGNGEKDYLLVADSATGDLKYSCVTSVAWDNFGIYLPAPIWSPDGKLLMAENRYTQDDSRLLVVDLEKNIAFPIAEDQFPIGWMLSDK